MIVNGNDKQQQLNEFTITYQNEKNSDTVYVYDNNKP